MRWKKFFIIFLLVILCLMSGIFLLRGQIVQWAFKKAQIRIHNTYKASLTARSIELSGLDDVRIKNLCLQPEGADTFIRIAEADVNISLLSLLRGNLSLGDRKSVV